MSPGDESQTIITLIRDLGGTARAPAAHELDLLRGDLAGRVLMRRTAALADRDILGYVWQGRLIQAGDRLPLSVIKYLKHAVDRLEWPARTSFQEYLESLTEAVVDPHGGIALERDAGSWKVTCVARSGRWRGPFGGPYIVVAFLPEKNIWLTGFQPEQGLLHVNTKLIESGGRWIRTPN